MARFRQGIYKSKMVRRLACWLDAMPHPPLAMEIASDRVSLVRWSRMGTVEGLAVEPLPVRALVPSAVESNIADLPAVQRAAENVCKRLGVREDEDVTLLLPDPVIRVFVQHFAEFPRRRQEALSLLRWKLKKSVPFDIDEMLLSHLRQAAQNDGVNVVTAVARLSIVREYEDVTRAAKLRPGVVLSSSIAAVALLEEDRPTIMARVAGRALTTSTVRGGMLRGYRCTELPAHDGALTPRMLLDEIFPVVAYYQDTWREQIQSLQVAGLDKCLREFAPQLEKELHCPVRSLLQSAVSRGQIPEDARALAERELEGMLGWMLHRG
jgi:type IV pilus assembly protein PilM